MQPNLKLVLIKITHTAIWVAYNIVFFYLAYGVIMDKIDVRVWICLGLIFLEILILLTFKNICPVTLIARKYSDSKKENFDIYLPNFIAKYNKLIYGIILSIILVILLYRILV